MNPVIFDFDGTLANSGPIIIECFDLTLKEEQGKEYPPEFYKPFIGPPLEETFGFLGAEDPARYITTYRRHYFQRMYDTPLFDGVRAMLEHLDDMGVPMAIATSKRRDAVLLLMQHLGIEERFKVVCGSGDDPSRGKKQHRVEDALTGLQELGIDTSEPSWWETAFTTSKAQPPTASTPSLWSGVKLRPKSVTRHGGSLRRRKSWRSCCCHDE